MQSGFIEWVNFNGNDRPQYLICNDILANVSLKISKRNRHLENNTTNFGIFSKKEKRFAVISKSFFVTLQLLILKDLLSSYLFAYRVAKGRLPHTLAEKVVLPVWKLCVLCLMKILPLNYPLYLSVTIQYQLQSISITGLLSGIDFAIQLDESTDNAN